MIFHNIAAPEEVVRSEIRRLNLSELIKKLEEMILVHVAAAKNIKTVMVYSREQVLQSDQVLFSSSIAF